MSARYKARTVFVRSNTGIVGSSPTQGMDVCVRLFCVDSGLAMGWPSHQRCPTDRVKDEETEKAAKVQQKDCRAIDSDFLETKGFYTNSVTQYCAFHGVTNVIKNTVLQGYRPN
jgi:hypothetical protein